MSSRLRDRLGTPAMIVSVIALVFALMGAAYAASGALTGKQKKEVEKIAKKSAGKPGAPGAQGPAGTNGKDGSNGTNGTNGTPGAPGGPGKSVKVTDASLVQCNELGGVIVEKEGEPVSAKEVCNGEPGPEGSPWTVDGTLPPGSTETGTWTLDVNETGTAAVPISFPIKLPFELGEGEGLVHFVPELGSGTCEGNLLHPSAPPGELCIYEGSLSGATFANIDSPGPSSLEAAGKSGALLMFASITGVAHGNGTWAVTAPSP